jgi:hypothetical protein
MIVSEARDYARQWVHEDGSRLPGFHGAYFTGSLTWLAEDAVVGAASDVDLAVVLGGAEAPLKLGKFDYHGALLEVSFTTFKQLGSAEEILAKHQVAGAFRAPNVIADPSGRLTELQAAVGSEYAKRAWVEKRCENARKHVLRYVGYMDESPPFHDAVIIWTFGAGVLAHVLLVAGLKNPTVRLRYLAARELLADYGLSDFYPTLLAPLGCANVSGDDVGRHMPALAEAFDAAAAALTTPVFFASDISAQSRHIAIDGSRELIERGDHLEALHWMLATYARSQHVLASDAPAAVYDEHDAGLRALLREFGIESIADIEARMAEVETLLPRVSAMTQTIMDSNAEIEAQG